MKRVRKNNRAFTMVEILAAVTILGIITTIAIVSISRILERSKDEYYKNQKDNIILAAESFVQDNRDRLPKNIGQTVRIQLDELVATKYLKGKIKDYDKNSCDLLFSYVEITKISQNDYSYSVRLICPAYKDKVENKENKSPKITITFLGANYKEAKVKLDFAGNDKLVGYNYVIYSRKDASSKYSEVKSSGSVEVNEKASVSLTIDVAGYLPGQIKVHASASNSYGKTKSADETYDYNDNIPPKCVYAKDPRTLGSQYVPGSSNHVPWSNVSSRTISVGCEDSGSGCVQEIYKQTFSSNGEYGDIQIADKAGNKTTCRVGVYLDHTKPSCSNITNNGAPNKWIKQNKTVTFRCDDSYSGCVQREFIKNYNIENGKTKDIDYITMKDQAGNVGQCMIGVYIDKAKPKCGRAAGQGSQSSWKTSRTIRQECTDEGSGCTRNIVSKTFSIANGAKIEKSKITISDQAGNSKDCDVKVYVETIPPKCTPYNTTTWARDHATAYALCTDNESGCETSRKEFVFNSSGSKNVVFYDKAGNYKSCTVSAMVDNKKPRCSGFAIGQYQNSSFIITVFCSDSQSGCSSTCNMRVPTLHSYSSCTIRDKVGHTRKCVYSDGVLKQTDD